MPESERVEYRESRDGRAKKIIISIALGFQASDSITEKRCGIRDALSEGPDALPFGAAADSIPVIKMLKDRRSFL